MNWPGNLFPVGAESGRRQLELDSEIDEIAAVEGSNIKYGESLSSNLYQLLQNAEQIKNEFGDTYIAVIH